MLSLARISKQFCEKQQLTFFNYAHYTDIILYMVKNLLVKSINYELFTYKLSKL